MVFQLNPVCVLLPGMLHVYRATEVLNLGETYIWDTAATADSTSGRCFAHFLNVYCTILKEMRGHEPG